MKKIAFLSLALALIIGACGKYPEGPGLSLASKKSRLAGDWNIKSHTIKSNTTTFDVLNSTISTTSPCLADFGNTIVTMNTVISQTTSISFEKDGNMSSTTTTSVTSDNWENQLLNCNTVSSTQTSSSNSTGTWEFGDKKETLIISQTTVPGNNYSKDEWEILELRKSQIQLTRTDSTNAVHLVVLQPK